MCARAMHAANARACSKPRHLICRSSVGGLAGFSGFLHADAYAGYGALYRSSGQLASKVMHVACFAHARRKFFEVWEATKSPIAEEAVRRIAKLYEIEAEIARRDADVRLAARAQPAIAG
jgi:transposase